MKLLLILPLKKRQRLCNWPCLGVCLSVCEQNYEKVFNQFSRSLVRLETTAGKESIIN